MADTSAQPNTNATPAPSSAPAEETREGAEAREASDARAVAAMEAWTHRAASLAKTTAEHVPAAVVAVVGGAVLLAADAFGVGEVVTAGLAGYAAYRLLARRARKRREERAEAEA